MKQNELTHLSKGFYPHLYCYFLRTEPELVEAVSWAGRDLGKLTLLDFL